MLNTLYTCQHLLFSLLNALGCLQPTFTTRTSGTNLGTSKPHFSLCLWISALLPNYVLKLRWFGDIVIRLGAGNQYSTWTWELTPWSRVLLHKLTVPKLVKKFPLFSGTKCSLSCSQQPSFVSIFSNLNQLHFVPLQFLKIYFNISLPFASSSSNWFYSSRLRHQNSVCTTSSWGGRFFSRFSDRLTGPTFLLLCGCKLWSCRSLNLTFHPI